MLNKKYCEPYMIAAFIIIVILGVLYTGTAKINLQYVRGVEISRADILIRSELLMLRTSIMYIVLLLVFTRTIRNDFFYCNILQHKKRTAIWNYQIKKLSEMGLAAALVYSGSTILSTSVICMVDINWQSADSFYALSTGDTIQVSYAVVIVAYIMAVILLTELILIVSLLLYWITNQMALVWIGILVFYVVDVYRVNKVFQLLMISYKNWRDEKIGVYMAVAAGVWTIYKNPCCNYRTNPDISHWWLEYHRYHHLCNSNCQRYYYRHCHSIHIKFGSCIFNFLIFKQKCNNLRLCRLKSACYNTHRSHRQIQHKIKSENRQDIPNHFSKPPCLSISGFQKNLLSCHL